MTNFFNFYQLIGKKVTILSENYRVDKDNKTLRQERSCIHWLYKSHLIFCRTLAWAKNILRNNNKVEGEYPFIYNVNNNLCRNQYNSSIIIMINQIYFYCKHHIEDFRIIALASKSLYQPISILNDLTMILKVPHYQKIWDVKLGMSKRFWLKKIILVLIKKYER